MPLYISSCPAYHIKDIVQAILTSFSVICKYILKGIVCVWIYLPTREPKLMYAERFLLRSAIIFQRRYFRPFIRVFGPEKHRRIPGIISSTFATVISIIAREKRRSWNASKKSTFLFGSEAGRRCSYSESSGFCHVTLSFVCSPLNRTQWRPRQNRSDFNYGRSRTVYFLRFKASRLWQCVKIALGNGTETAGSN